MPDENTPPLDAPYPAGPKSLADASIVPEGPPDRAMLRERRLHRMKERTVLSDCIVMLRYALDEGCALSDKLISDIAAIDAILIEAGDDPLSERPFNLRKIKTPPADPTKVAEVSARELSGGVQGRDAGPAVAAPIAPAGDDKGAAVINQPAVANANGGANPDELLLRIHNGLSSLVAPATAISLRATDPDVVKYGLPWIAKIALAGALISTFIFIIAVSNPRPGSNAGPPSTPGPAGTASATATPSERPSATP